MLLIILFLLVFIGTLSFQYVKFRPQAAPDPENRVVQIAGHQRRNQFCKPGPHPAHEMVVADVECGQTFD